MPGRTVEAGLQLFEDQVAVGPLAPGFEVDLDLADRVAGRAHAAGVVVEPAVTGEGEDVAHALLGQHDLLGLSHQRVHLVDGQVAARPDIDDGLFRLGLDEELHAVVVGAEIGEDAQNEARDGGDDHERHHRVGDQKVDEPAEGRAPVTGLNRALGARDMQRAHHHRHQRRGHHEQQRAGQHRHQGQVPGAGAGKTTPGLIVCIAAMNIRTGHARGQHRGARHTTEPGPSARSTRGPRCATSAPRRRRGPAGRSAPRSARPRGRRSASREACP
jgi:hypothetical protein